MTKNKLLEEVIIVGGGLAGCEAAWQAAKRGIKVTLYEMRPEVMTGAHTSGLLAELVCSNSLGSNLQDRASGVLKEELRILGSLLLYCAEETAVPAGGALAVDRDLFATQVTQTIQCHPNIKVIRKEAVDIPPSPTIIASGPLTSPGLSRQIQNITGEDHLFFFDAIAPIVSIDSIDMNLAYKGSRFGRGKSEDGDYINCPMTRDEYEEFVDMLLNAQRIELKGFELEIENGVKTGVHRFFEGCLPVEILARRGRDALAYGPMRPVGLTDPRTGQRPYAVVQLRQDNQAATLYNMVGFQTNLTISEQQRVFRTIPGLKNALFYRYGQMHRNTFIFSPTSLYPNLQFRQRPDLFFAGQITGVEGYTGNIATGLLGGVNITRYLRGQELLAFPETTIIGSLLKYITKAEARDFQPMKANFGLLPPLEGEGGENMRLHGRREKARLFADRSLRDLRAYISGLDPAY